MPDPVELVVRLNDSDVGVLTLNDNLSTFEFLDSHLETPKRSVLGQMFEDSPRSSWRQAMFVPAWFANLLPEDPMLSFVAHELGINPKNEFRMLEALGQDLPGAITLELATTGFRGEVGPRVVESTKSREPKKQLSVRFSIAGVQFKLSMLIAENTLTLAGEGELGNHLVKFPSATFADVPENEFSMMTWAKSTGLDVPDVELKAATQLDLPDAFSRFRENNVFVIKRYDRQNDTRIHQEDFNQVLGNRPDKKYEGASYERLGLMINVICGADDCMEYIRRLLFCVAIGNEDAHLKNWSIVYPDGIHARLAPGYDYVSTIQYEGLDREMALRLGGTRRAQTITMDVLERLARKAGVDPKEARREATDTIQRMGDAWNEISPDLPVSTAFKARLAAHQAEVPLVAQLSQLME